MPDPEIGVNTTQVPNDILLRLVGATEEIRDLLRQKAGQGNETAQQIHQALQQDEDSPEVAVTNEEPPNDHVAIVEINDHNNWPSVEKMAEYRIRCAKHKSECKKMQAELGCFIAHLGIVGGYKGEIEKAEWLRNKLLDPVQYLEKVFDATTDGRPTAMEEVRKSFHRFESFVSYFAYSPHQKGAVYPDEVKKWRSITYNGYSKIFGLVSRGKLVECLEFIHNVFFSELEMAMGCVVEALTTFEEKSASEWLTIGDFENRCEEYISRAFRPKVLRRSLHFWLEAETISKFVQLLTTHKKSCNQMHEEKLEHLKSHYLIIGGDKTVVEASRLLQDTLLEPVKWLERAMAETSDKQHEAIKAAIASFAKLHSVLDSFQRSLYHQKHAFYFRKVKKWVACVRNGLPKLLVISHDVNRFLTFLCDDFFLGLNSTMIGACDALEEQKMMGIKMEKADSGCVAEELKSFGKESLPKFLVDQMERDTTRYINLTTIATFFSSVTATTLQFTYAPLDSEPSNSLRGVVNLFWFLSLVFSVSSGVSSLLGLTWRKSSIYDSRVPPKLIRMWFDKAPMLFLIIAAVAFVIGLNMFAYLSLQPRYVSFSTTILTGIHGACLLIVTTWFIYQLKHESRWAGWVRTVMKPITKIAGWIWKLVKRPYKKYNQNLHLQRNIYWAFGMDNRVARLNYDIDWRRDWPGPYILSRLIRCIAYPIKRCCLATKKALSGLSHTVRAHICVPSHTGDAGDDVERGENGRRKEAEAPEETSSETLAMKAENEFRGSLQKIFSDTDFVNFIMREIDFWEVEIINNDEDDFKRRFKGYFWGYPDLFNTMCEELRPALAEARKERIKKEDEEDEKWDVSTGNRTISEATCQDEHDTTPVPARSGQTVPLDDEPEALDVTQIVARPDSQGQLDSHPPTLDDHVLFIGSGNTDALEPTSGDLIPQTEPRARATTTNEIEEVLSTLESENEGL